MALNPPVFTVAELRAHIGQEVGCASWLTISQGMIDTFANLTNDHQYIHVDPPRAMTETSYGGTIVHGFLALSMLTQMLMSAVPTIRGTSTSINYGFDKIRFLSPVRSDSAIRGRFMLAAVEERAPNELTVRYETTLEIRDNNRPALFADWLIRLYLR
jgi:acyl dehydratase